MKVALNWLKDYVDIDLPPEELADKLTRAGIAVDSVSYPGAGIDGVVTGRVTQIERHPEADKLWICLVDVQDGVLRIVTGADNVTAGAIVPVARIGARLPDGRIMKKARLRGVESEGMLCSASELAIEDKLLRPEERVGIFILPPDTPPGLDIKQVLSLDGAVLELDLTANRGDCLSMVGVAREVAALTGRQVQYPPCRVNETAEAKPIDIHIEDPTLCPRFTARSLCDITIRPSPLWLQNRLRLAGMRPLNNVVDVTNYVMLEWGQPMHAYDSETLAGAVIGARAARPGEKLITLDGGERELAEGMIVIADRDKAVGLGGVMGGLNTEITAGTRYVLLEAACFDPARTRKTSRALSLASEASSRFIHGIDRENIINALDRAAHLLEQLGAAKICAGRMDNYPGRQPPAVIRATADGINSRIGAQVSVQRMVDILTSLGFDVTASGEELSVTVPAWRNDVQEAADISEEIARSIGFDNIPGTLPGGVLRQGGQSRLGSLSLLVKDFLASSGLNEMIGYSFINEAALGKLKLPAGDIRQTPIPLKNPITDEFTVMRTTLLPGVLNAAAYNLARRNEDIALFEIGKIYLAEELPLEDFPREKTMLCAILTGRRHSRDWSHSKENMDFYDMKGLSEGLLGRLNLNDCVFAPGQAAYLHPGKSAAIIYDGCPVGLVGELHPETAAAFGLPSAFILELELDCLAYEACQVAKYEKLPRYPASYRDLSMTVPEDLSHGQISRLIRDSGGSLLKAFNLFDLYAGKQIPNGYKSMAWSLVFQDSGRTLTDEEVNAATAAIVAALESKLSIKLRVL